MIRITDSKYSAVACRSVSVKEYISLSAVVVQFTCLANAGVAVIEKAVRK